MYPAPPSDSPLPPPNYLESTSLPLHAVLAPFSSLNLAATYLGCLVHAYWSCVLPAIKFWYAKWTCDLVISSFERKAAVTVKVLERIIQWPELCSLLVCLQPNKMCKILQRHFLWSRWLTCKNCGTWEDTLTLDAWAISLSPSSLQLHIVLAPFTSLNLAASSIGRLVQADQPDIRSLHLQWSSSVRNGHEVLHSTIEL